jgi:energy-coupling factor transporter ATP-binding protein EcfA2
MSISSILGVSVCAGPFGEGTRIDLFSKPAQKNIKNQSQPVSKPHRASAIFGHNGSGKSTVAESIASMASGANDDCYFYDANGDKVTLDDAVRSRVRVFGEDYVEKKIHLEDDGLGAIVMLGDQAEARRKIADIDKELGKANDAFDELKERRESLESGPESVSKLEDSAKKCARDGGWVTRRAQIEGKQTSRLTPQRWDEIEKSSTERPRKELERDFIRQMEDFTRASAWDEPLEEIELEDSEDIDEESLIGLLTKEIEEPVLTGRERRILSLIQNGDQTIVERARAEFAHDDTTTCPMCQQEVSPEYKASLENSILKVLNKEVDDFKEALTQVKLTEFEEKKLPEHITSDSKLNYRSTLERVNELVRRYNELVRQRLGNLYSPLDVQPLGLREAVEDLNASLGRVNEEIKSINEVVSNRVRTQRRLSELNDEIAWWDARGQLEKREKTRKALESVLEEIMVKAQEISRLQARKGEQEALLRQTKIAADVINQYLAIVYFDVNRFRIIAEGERYRIRSNGASVKPEEISTGERNMLGLCYFFAEGGQGKPRGSEDNEVQYVVLDDPVSSFDMENRVGIMSLLRERFAHILESNNESKITVMTHDIGVMYELQHTFDDIDKQFREESCKLQVDYLELSGSSTQNMALKKAEYTLLLNKAYRFAKGEECAEDEGCSIEMGNILRRVLEGYGTFTYAKGITQLSRDGDIMGKFGDDAPIMANVMHRLFLNDGSHMEERVKAFNPSYGANRYSEDEKRACAQYVLVFLYEMDPIHVIRHMAEMGVEKPEVENHIAEWKKRFKQTGL